MIPFLSAIIPIFNNMSTFSLLTATLLIPFVLSVALPATSNQPLDPLNHGMLTEPLNLSYKPASFIETYNQTYCPSSTTAVFIPPVFAYYPFNPTDVYKVVGSFVNITWISPAFNDTTFVGTDNVPGGTYLFSICKQYFPSNLSI